MTRRGAMPPEERTDFVNLPATSPALARIDPRAEGAGRQEWPAAAGSSAVSAAVDAGPSSS
jgi:hypothetical protein